jgi:hypothetical protein
MKLKVENLTGLKFVGKNLMNAIYVRAQLLEADYVEINKAKYDAWADIALFEGGPEGDCIAWHDEVNTF